MFVWGTKRKLKRLGIVAEYCSICREIKPFEIASLSMVNHLYFLSIGPGKVVGFIATCKECNIEMRVDARKYPKSFYKESSSIQDLIQETNPNIKDIYSNRLALETKILNKEPLTHEERDLLLNEPFDFISPMLEQRYGESTKFDKKSGRSCAITLIIPFIFLCISMFFMEQIIDDFLKIIASILVVIGIVITVIFIFTTHPRYLKQFIYPALAKSLTPLNPTIEELDKIINMYKGLDMQIGKRIDPQIIIDTIKIHEKT